MRFSEGEDRWEGFFPVVVAHVAYWGWSEGVIWKGLASVAYEVIQGLMIRKVSCLVYAVEIINFWAKGPINYFHFVLGSANHVARPARGDGALKMVWARLWRALSVKLENIWLYSRSSGEPWEVWWQGLWESGGTREAGSPWREADQIMLEQTWQIPRAIVVTPGGDGPALGTGDKGGEGGWRWLRFLAGLEILLSNRNEGERSPHASGSEADVLQEWGKALPKKTRKSLVGQLVETCSAAAQLQQMTCRSRFFVSIESFTRTNIHPKINFPFFLFL